MKKLQQKNSNELWQTTFDWLKLCGNKLSSRYVKEDITTHPDYPALTSVVDFLDQGRFASKVVQADASYINYFNYPLLAHIRQPGQEYLHIIRNISSWDQQKNITQYWSGIVVYPEKSASWQNDQNNIYEQNELKQKILASAFIVTGLLFVIISALQLSYFTISIFGLLSLLGLTISLFLLGTEFGVQSQIVKQVCGAVSNGGCEKVLKSSYGQGIAGISPTDASVLYFAAQLIVYLLGCWQPQLLIAVILLSFFGIVVACWSIYTQAIKLKQYCALCLSIVAVLLLQSITAFVIYRNLIPAVLSIETNTVYTAACLFALIWFIALIILLPIKQLIKTNHRNKIKLAELKKWKTDAGLFINLWQQEQAIDTAIWEKDLILGNPSAPLLITVACNPYCGPCAKAHKQLDDLLLRFEHKLKIQIRLLCDPEKENDKRTIAVKAILQKAVTSKSNAELQQLLSDWFEWMNIEKWETKWLPDNTIDVAERLKQHNNWVEASAIAFTPTFFINGRKLPGRYSLNDIEILIPQLVELLTNKETQ